MSALTLILPTADSRPDVIVHGKDFIHHYRSSFFFKCLVSRLPRIAVITLYLDLRDKHHINAAHVDSIHAKGISGEFIDISSYLHSDFGGYV